MLFFKKENFSTMEHNFLATQEFKHEPAHAWIMQTVHVQGEAVVTI